jgi:hypothetical protein
MAGRRLGEGDANRPQCLCSGVPGGRARGHPRRARTWRAACDAPRFLPALPSWLAAHGWEKPPPTKANRDRGSHSKRGHRSNGGDKGISSQLLEEAGYVEEGGEMVWGGLSS